ncbi:MAG: glycosyltransferase [Pseudomonadota bacterium]
MDPQKDLLSYSVVIATRNRPAALALSIPLLQGQSRAPAEIIVIDASDDPGPSREIVEGLARTLGADIRFVRAARKGISFQRNQGLALVRAPVVLLPDDDSLFLPKAAAEILAVYERDREGLVGGVCGREVRTAPEGVLETATYRERRGDTLRRWLFRAQIRFERRFFPDPFLSVADAKYRALTPPPWLEPDRHALVETMTGFRMSFRTEVLRAIGGFDETLGSYSLGEDVDASLRVLDSHVLVGALQAEVFHYKDPSARDTGFGLGVIQILNRAYIVAKNTGLAPHPRKVFLRFARYKCAQYAAGALVRRSAFSRDRAHGARAALRHVPALFEAAPSEVETRYQELRAALLPPAS